MEIKDIKPEVNALYYRQKYDAKAYFYSDIHGDLVVKIHFVVEISPLGEKKIMIKFLEEIGYPLIPLIRLLRERILELHNNGHLY